MTQGAHGAPKKPEGAKEHFGLSKGQKQCGIAVVIIIAICAASHFLSPKEKAKAEGKADVKAAKAKAPVGPSVVTALNDNTFDTFMAANPDGVLVDFQSDSCSFCKKLAPEYEAAARELKAKGGPPLASVNKEGGAELMNKYEIDRFPSVFWFWKGQKTIEYARAAEKNASQIVDWADWAQTPALQELENSEYSENIDLLRSSLHGTQVLFVGFKSAGQEDVRTILEAAAVMFRATTVFLYIHDTSVAGPFLKAIAPEAANDADYTGALTAGDFVTWAREIVDRKKIAELEAKKKELEAQTQALKDEMAKEKEKDAQEL